MLHPVKMKMSKKGDQVLKRPTREELLKNGQQEGIMLDRDKWGGDRGWKWQLTGDTG